jgi:oligopeptide/dipeptide ABC transporter ATP-binding protein
LLDSVPRTDRGKQALRSIEGLPPRLDQGAFEECAFRARCAHARDVCRDGEPELVEIARDHQRRCARPVGEVT